MKGIYKAVEVSSPGRPSRGGTLSSLNLERVKFGFAWKHANLSTPMPPRSLAFIRVSLARVPGMKWLAH